jgi:hypothetical protein
MTSNEAFTSDPIISATENYSLNTNYITSPKFVKLSVPRFSQGEGSFIQLNASLYNHADAKQAGLLVYTTYDGGSKILYPPHAYNLHFVLPILLVLAAIASFTVPYVYQRRINRRRDFATRILFDFMHLYGRLDRNISDNRVLMKDDMGGRKLWKKYDEQTKKRLLRIDPKFFYMEESFPEIAQKKDIEKYKYDYYNSFIEGYEALEKRDKVLKSEIDLPEEDLSQEKKEKIQNENRDVKKKCGNILTKTRWDVYGI